MEKMDIHVRIGKNGLSDAMCNEISEQLKKKRVIKIKFLRSFIEGRNKKETAKELANLVNATIVEQIGFTVVLKK